MALQYYIIMICMVASAFTGYLTVRAKYVDKDFRRTTRFMYLTVFLTLVWMLFVIFTL